jgi:hypothetical protein
MKDRHLTLAILALAIAAIAADAPSFTGEYADKKFLGGNAVLQMSLEQSGNTVSVWFSAIRNSGEGADPEATATGKVAGNGKVEFSFTDSFKNSGTGTIARAGDDILVSLKATRVTDSRCVAFYGQNMRLKRVKK